MAGLLDSEVQLATNEGRTLNQNQIPDDSAIDVPSHAYDALARSESRKRRNIKWTLLLGSFIFEGLSLAFDQLSSSKKPIYAFMSMITASLGLVISIIELSYRVRENDMIISRLLGDASGNFGFFGSIWQCVNAVVQYVYLYEKKVNNPIKISVLPLIFLICAAISKLYKKYCGESSTPRHSYKTGESSVDVSRMTTLSRVESSISQGNARAIEETEPLVEDHPGVLIPTKEFRNGTTVHRRIQKRRLKRKSGIKRLRALKAKIRDEQICGKEGQKQDRKRHEKIVVKGKQLCKEMELTAKPSADIQMRLNLMFRILKARVEEDTALVAQLTQSLRDLIAKKNEQIQ
ncbi:putative disease resistance RPP13-like protein 1 [Tripterygium wilfordii]|uniref:Putative disease resistance RPP13-like protein 1 n=1 Tax=Tripterygium wilfordii TaxID=458696 RepID=A0A7J7D606_TRIWF|nr:uncharacterized protein LOC120007783 [Tripterygium wilfordii]XP_038714162.1 uncharacterized protein LOC120007783 [Tripterygium wilfordii]XP_038714163.1 uncharacterized protein LOC120007783 [Tripterygium wilfordii]KAF5741496.1 putative disease resistance RPP13-like protein 1 [Tripterygium wilfordii]